MSVICEILNSHGSQDSHRDSSELGKQYWSIETISKEYCLARGIISLKSLK
jgi:hypothetical protein